MSTPEANFDPPAMEDQLVHVKAFPDESGEPEPVPGASFRPKDEHESEAGYKWREQKWKQRQQAAAATPVKPPQLRPKPAQPVQPQPTPPKHLTPDEGVEETEPEIRQPQTVSGNLTEDELTPAFMNLLEQRETQARKSGKVSYDLAGDLPNLRQDIIHLIQNTEEPPYDTSEERVNNLLVNTLRQLGAEKAINRLSFEDQLVDNPADIDTRLIYADWLEENGYEQEGQKQRRVSTALQDIDKWMKEDLQKWMKGRAGNGRSNDIWNWANDPDVEVRENLNSLARPLYYQYVSANAGGYDLPALREVFPGGFTQFNEDSPRRRLFDQMFAQVLKKIQQEEEGGQKSLPTPQKALSLIDFTTHLKEAGWETLEHHHLTLADLLDLTQQGHCILCPTQNAPQTIVVDVGLGHIHTADGEMIPVNEWLPTWEYEEDGKKYLHYGLVLINAKLLRTTSKRGATTGPKPLGPPGIPGVGIGTPKIGRVRAPRKPQVRNSYITGQRYGRGPLKSKYCLANGRPAPCKGLKALETEEPQTTPQPVEVEVQPPPTVQAPTVKPSRLRQGLETVPAAPDAPVSSSPKRTTNEIETPPPPKNPRSDSPPPEESSGDEVIRLEQESERLQELYIQTLKARKEAAARNDLEGVRRNQVGLDHLEGEINRVDMQLEVALVRAKDPVLATQTEGPWVIRLSTYHKPGGANLAHFQTEAEAAAAAARFKREWGEEGGYRFAVEYSPIENKFLHGKVDGEEVVRPNASFRVERPEGVTESLLVRTKNNLFGMDVDEEHSKPKPPMESPIAPRGDSLPAYTKGMLCPSCGGKTLTDDGHQAWCTNSPCEWGLFLKEKALSYLNELSGGALVGSKPIRGQIADQSILGGVLPTTGLGARLLDYSRLKSLREKYRESRQHRNRVEQVDDYFNQKFQGQFERLGKSYFKECERGGPGSGEYAGRCLPAGQTSQGTQAPKKTPRLPVGRATVTYTSNQLDANRPSSPENRKNIDPPKLAWVDPPKPRGKIGFGPRSSAQNVAIGDLGEEITKHLNLRRILPEGLRHNLNVEQEGSSMDREFDHSGWAFEVKLCNIDSSEFRAKPKKKDIEDKLRYCQLHGLKPATLIIIHDAESKQAWFYWTPGLSTQGVPKTRDRQGNWNFCGQCTYSANGTVTWSAEKRKS